MRRLLVLPLVLALTVVTIPATLLAADTPSDATITGVALGSDQRPVGNMMVRPRNVDTASVAGGAATNARGEYVLSNLSVGRYVVEAVDAGGRVIGSSAVVAVAAGAAATATVSVPQARKNGETRLPTRSFMKRGGIVLIAAGVAGVGSAYVALRNPGKPCPLAGQ